MELGRSATGGTIGCDGPGRVTSKEGAGGMGSGIEVSVEAAKTAGTPKSEPFGGSCTPLGYYRLHLEFVIFR